MSIDAPALTFDPTGPFLGREQELDAFREALADTAGGSAGFVLVAGPPGIGKTRLVSEAATLAGDHGFRLLSGATTSTAPAPLEPWVRVLRTYVQSREAHTLRSQIGERAAYLAALLPEISDRLGVSPAPVATGSATAVQRLFDLVRDLLASAASERPLMVVLEDLHWADATSVELLDHLVLGEPVPGMLVVATAREMEAMQSEPVADGLRRAGGVGITLRLGGLSTPDVGRFLERRLGRSPDEAEVAEVLRASGGNPLLIENVGWLVSERGLTSVGAGDLPVGAAELIRERLDLLPDAVEETLLAASVFGTDFFTTPLAVVRDIDRAAAVEHMTEARSHGLVASTRATVEQSTFAHAVVASHLYETIPADERAEWHARAGEALEALYGEDASRHAVELAVHFTEAVPLVGVERALEYRIAAGEQAARALGHADAARHYRAALDLVGEASPALRCEIETRLAETRWRTGDFEGTREAAEHAAELARQLDSWEHLARAALALGGGVWIRLDLEPVEIDLLEEALERAPSDDHPLRIQLLSRLALPTGYAPGAGAESLERSQALAAEAVERARNLGDPALLAYPLFIRHLGLERSRESIEERRAVTDELRDVADQLDDPEVHLWAIGWSMFDCLIAGDLAGWESELARYQERAARFGDGFYLFVGMASVPIIPLLRGPLGEARQAVAAFEQVAGSVDDPEIRVLQTAFRIELARLGGDVDATEVYDEFRGVAADAADYSIVQAFVASWAWRRGDEQTARRIFDDFADDDFRLLQIDVYGPSCMALLAPVAAGLGDHERSARLYEQLLPLADSTIADGRPVQPVIMSAHHALGILAAGLSRHGDAVEHLKRALVRHRAMGAERLVIETEIELARVLLERELPGDAERAFQLAGTTREAAEHRGFAGLVAELARLPLPDRTEVEDRVVFSLRSVGDLMEVGVVGAASRVKPTKGLRYLRALVAAPGRELHALELQTSGESTTTSVAEAAEAGLAPSAHHAGPKLDDRAKEDYRARLVDLHGVLQEAEANHDHERSSRAREEIDVLTRELGMAVGLTGKDRHASDDAERARVNVTRAIRTAIDKVAEQDAAMARHLHETIQTGIFCSYRPEGGDLPAWRL